MVLRAPTLTGRTGALAAKEPPGLDTRFTPAAPVRGGSRVAVRVLDLQVLVEPVIWIFRRDRAVRGRQHTEGALLWPRLLQLLHAAPGLHAAAFLNECLQEALQVF